MPDLNNLACTAADFGGLSAELLRLGKCVRFQAQGVSMRPLVRDGDILLVLPVQAKNLRVGDVVLCQCGEKRVVVHRVVRKRKDGRYLVQGDQALQPDGWVGVDDIYGRVVELERNGQQLNLLVLNAKILAILAALRSRGLIKQGCLYRIIGGRIKTLPVFRGYLT